MDAFVRFTAQVVFIIFLSAIGIFMLRTIVRIIFHNWPEE